MRVAFSSMALKTGSNSPGDELMMRSTSAVAFSRSRASSRSRLRRAISVSRAAVVERRLGLAAEVGRRFDVTVL